MELHLWKRLIQSKNRIFQIALLSLFGLAVPFCLGMYNRSVDDSEGYHEFYSFPKAAARPVIMKYGGDGILHRLISPHTIGGTLALTNAGGPVKVRMRMLRVPQDLAIHWGNSHTRDFNLKDKTVERVLNKGDSISVHHTFYIGEGLRKKTVLFNGGLEITDEATGKILLTIPIRILKAGSSRPQSTEDACHE
jgi:hypothetical protein